MADTTQDTIGLIKSESLHLQRYLSGLSPEALSHPSLCEAWDVGDVIAHLVWFV